MPDLSLRTMILGLLLFGIVGLMIELLLLEHFDSLTQAMPLVSLGAGLASTFMVTLRPGRAAFLAFRVMMAALVITGVIGLYLHFAGNMEWALERDPDLNGMALLWKALRGATPALAPGAMAQLGLLGLVYAHRHPPGDAGKIVTNNSGETS